MVSYALKFDAADRLARQVQPFAVLLAVAD